MDTSNIVISYWPRCVALVLFGALSLHGAVHAAKSPDDCQAEAAALPQDKQQAAVIACLVEDAQASAPESKQKPRPKRTIGKTTPQQIARIRAAMVGALRDPYSAVLSGLYTLTTKTSPDITVCGFVNAKNGFGAYVGEAPFMYLELERKGSFHISGDGLFDSLAPDFCRGDR